MKPAPLIAFVALVVVPSILHAPSVEAGLFGRVAAACAKLLTGEAEVSGVRWDPQLDPLPPTWLKLPTDAVTKVYGPAPKRAFALFLTLVRPGESMRASVFMETPPFHGEDRADHAAKIRWYAASLVRQGIHVEKNAWFLRNVTIPGGGLAPGYADLPYDSLLFTATIPIESLAWLFSSQRLISFSVLEYEPKRGPGETGPGFEAPPRGMVGATHAFSGVDGTVLKAAVRAGRVPKKLAREIRRARDTERFSLTLQTYRGALPQIYRILGKYGGSVQRDFPGERDGALDTGYLDVQVSPDAAYELVANRFVAEVNYRGRSRAYLHGYVPSWRY